MLFLFLFERETIKRLGKLAEWKKVKSNGGIGRNRGIVQRLGVPDSFG